jgi:hypothetical protein
MKENTQKREGGRHQVLRIDVVLLSLLRHHQQSGRVGGGGCVGVCVFLLCNPKQWNHSKQKQ